ncbi:SDR family oxidoreductase, partial [Staphylococcus aureus]
MKLDLLQVQLLTAAAKGAVTNMTRQDAISFGKDHIRVNSVHPGTI